MGITMKLPSLSSIVPDRTPTPAKMFLVGVILGNFGGGIYTVVIQLYLLTLGFDSSDIGAIFMMNAVGSVLLTIPAGILADRYGKKIIFLLGWPIGALSALFYLGTESVELFYLAFLFLGFFSATTVVWNPIYSSFFRKEDMDRAFGLLGFIRIISRSLGSILGLVPPLLVAHYGFSLQNSYWLMLVLDLGFFFASMPFYILSFKNVAKPVRQERVKFTIRSKSVIAKFSFLAILMMLGYGIFLGLFPFYVNKKFGIESDALGTLLAISNFVSAGASAIAARVSKRLGTLKAIVASIALSTPFYLMMPLAPNFAWLSVLYILRLGIRGIANPLINSLFMKILRDDEKATANSIRMMAQNSGNIAAPWLGGQLMEQVSLDVPAYLGAGIYIAHATSYYFLLKNEEKVNSQLEPKV
jgi:MFS family permease